ncbi:MAG: glycosyltransferase family 4 protein [Bacteroidales bacterium]|nr:glycosyltransferase family 4 protein [Bacteroidales bacterium]
MSSRNELIQVVSSIRFGGPERYALDISRHFSVSGWKVTAFTRDAKAVDSVFRDYRIRLRHAPLGGAFDIPSALSLSRMMRLMPQSRGVVHVHHIRDAFMALLARKIAKRKDVRIILTVHSIRKGRDNRLSRRIFRNLDAIIFVSQTVASRFLSTWSEGLSPIPPDRIHILHNSLYLPDFSGPVPPPEKGPVIAMYHGTIAPGKGLEYLIDALPRLKPLRLRLRIAGNGDPDYVDSLRRRAQARNVMEMIDWRKHPINSISLINEVHIGVLPTVNEEPFGLSNTEYMAAGRPQICTARGAQQEYLTDGREAFIVLPGDTTSIADALIRLTSDPQLRLRMGREAHKSFARSLDWQRFSSQLAEIYLPTPIND